MSTLLETARTAAAKHGVLYCGICPIERLSHLIDCRKKGLVPQSGGVIALLLPYYTGMWPERNVSLYAVPDDYHRIAGVILEEVAECLRQSFPTGSFTAFVDSSPIPEVEAACLCGLGFRGKHGQLINKDYGSMTFIGEIVTDLPVEGWEEPPVGGTCGSCRRCLEACPTGALTALGLTRPLCRSAITQKKGVLSAWEQEQIKAGGLVWGCDLCTLACPHNYNLPYTPIAGMQDNLTPLVTAGGLEELLQVKSYGWRGKAVLERNLAIVEAF
ncbi:MAG: DUF1730 domain-containing protein [Angelakisella sp.]